MTEEATSIQNEAETKPLESLQSKNQSQSRIAIETCLCFASDSTCNDNQQLKGTFGRAKLIPFSTFSPTVRDLVFLQRYWKKPLSKPTKRLLKMANVRKQMEDYAASVVATPEFFLRVIRRKFGPVKDVEEALKSTGFDTFMKWKAFCYRMELQSGTTISSD